MRMGTGERVWGESGTPLLDLARGSSSPWDPVPLRTHGVHSWVPARGATPRSVRVWGCAVRGARGCISHVGQVRPKPQKPGARPKRTNRHIAKDAGAARHAPQSTKNEGAAVVRSPLLGNLLESVAARESDRPTCSPAFRCCSYGALLCSPSLCASLRGLWLSRSISFTPP